MVPGTRFRHDPGATSRSSTFGAALVGLALIGSTAGTTFAQDASPAASPVAVAEWITAVAIDATLEAEGDTTTVGIQITDPLAIATTAFETRPIVQLQANNLTTAAVTVVVLTAPEGFDATGFALPADEADLPDGVTPYGSFEVAAGTQATAIFPDLPAGTYVLATTDGQSLVFVVSPQAEADVPDIFATPAN